VKSRLDLALAAALVICIARLWLMPLPSSFWLDETVTAFIVRHGADHPSLAVAPQLTASVYYFLPRLFVSALGGSEIAYRLPSVLAMLVTLFLIGRLAARLIHPDAAWFAVFASLLLGGINYQAADARPYALGTCVAAAGFLSLVRWLDSGRRTYALLFILFAGLLWRVHLIYWPIYLAFAVYAAARIVLSETRVTWAGAAAWFGLLGVLLLPVLLEALVVLREAAAHTFTPIPENRALGNSFKLGLIASCGGVALLFGLFQPRGSNTASAVRFRSPVILIAAWWLLHPVCLFLYSRLSGNSVFLNRYLWVALPGAVLAATYMAARAMPPHRWRHAALVLGAGALIWMGEWRTLWPLHDPSNWRAASRQLQEIRIGPDTPVITPSALLEARPPAWRPDYSLPGFFYCHLDFYPIPGKWVLFPYEPSPRARSPEALSYATLLVESQLPAAGRFAIYGREVDIRFWVEWFAERAELAGWRHTRYGPFGNIGVAVFERAPEPMEMELDN
jgi:hypothetical protein